MSRLSIAPVRRRHPRLLVEVAILVTVGVAMAVLGPFGSTAAPALARLGYWIFCIVSGGLIGVGFDRLFHRRQWTAWRTALAAATAMTLPTVPVVLLANRLFFGQRPEPGRAWSLFAMVFAVSLIVMAVRVLAWRRPPPVVETRTVVEPPLPAATEAFRRRLSARHRHARLVAVEAQDHYLRVHTETGTELITARMADAVNELSAAHGYQVHRSWWVAGDAIEAVVWSRGTGDVTLTTGTVAPVSRSRAPILKRAGW